MNGEMDIINNMVKFIGGLSIEALLVISLVVLGYVLKIARFFPNRFIPIAVIMGGMVIYPFLGNPATLNPELGHAVTVKWAMAMQGLLLGFSAWVAHAVVLRKLVDERLNGTLNPDKKDHPAPPTEPKPPTP